jgi:hypothetical protein
MRPAQGEEPVRETSSQQRRWAWWNIPVIPLFCRPETGFRQKYKTLPEK